MRDDWNVILVVNKSFFGSVCLVCGRLSSWYCLRPFPPEHLLPTVHFLWLKIATEELRQRIHCTTHTHTPSVSLCVCVCVTDAMTDDRWLLTEPLRFRQAGTDGCSSTAETKTARSHHLVAPGTVKGAATATAQRKKSAPLLFIKPGETVTPLKESLTTHCINRRPRWARDYDSVCKCVRESEREKNEM